MNAQQLLDPYKGSYGPCRVGYELIGSGTRSSMCSPVASTAAPQPPAESSGFLGVPWWGWHNLGPDWKGIDPPTSRATVMGGGSYDNLGFLCFSRHDLLLFIGLRLCASWYCSFRQGKMPLRSNYPAQTK